MRKRFEAADTGRASVRMALIIAAAAFAIVFGWHIRSTGPVVDGARDFVSRKLPGIEVASVSVEPITNVVSVAVKIKAVSRSDNPLGALGEALSSALGTALTGAFEPALERELNLRARESFDVYAMVLPYRVRVTEGEGA